MAIRDWSGWHVGLAWVAGLAMIWLLLRRSSTVVSGQAVSGAGSITGGSLPVWAVVVVVAILVALGIVTIRWFR